MTGRSWLASLAVAAGLLGQAEAAPWPAGTEAARAHPAGGPVRYLYAPHGIAPGAADEGALGSDSVLAFAALQRPQERVAMVHYAWVASAGPGSIETWRGLATPAGWIGAAGIGILGLWRYRRLKRPKPAESRLSGWAA